jgi:hypothetical protein
MRFEEEPMDTAWSVVVSAVVGLVAGVVGSLIAPWVNWGIEKRRDKLKHRWEIIQRCRDKVDSPDFTKQEFRATTEYRYLKPLLDAESQRSIEGDHIFMVPERGDSPDNVYRKLLAEAIDKLEGQWRLV